jgi:hypothetical protein
MQQACRIFVQKMRETGSLYNVHANATLQQGMLQHYQYRFKKKFIKLQGSFTTVLF